MEEETMELKSFGPINGHAVGIIMKEVVRRAIAAIRAERFAFEAKAKLGYTGKLDDMLTSADGHAQAIYLKSLRECFPLCGIVAEEDELSITSQQGCSAYFTVDPLDGTKAYVRRQSHGVGTMVALVDNRRTIAAYIGDTNTLEIYGFRPGSDSAHRISEFGFSELLTIDEGVPLSEQYILLREPERKYSEAAQQVITGKFKSSLCDGSSIGTWMARLWKREVGGLLMPPSHETPWDSTPIYAISKKIGFVFLKPTSSKGWEQFEPKPQHERYWRHHELLIIHGSRSDEFNTT
jgi:fructose-1,6-bisphosphatase/inositol monophosphatase family enzyme